MILAAMFLCDTCDEVFRAAGTFAIMKDGKVLCALCASRKPDQIKQWVTTTREVTGSRAYETETVDNEGEE